LFIHIYIYIYCSLSSFFFFLVLILFVIIFLFSPTTTTNNKPQQSRLSVALTSISLRGNAGLTGTSLSAAVDLLVGSPATTADDEIVAAQAHEIAEVISDPCPFLNFYRTNVPTFHELLINNPGHFSTSMASFCNHRSPITNHQYIIVCSSTNN
jgi:hypothetical protein